ncbi:MAG: hypothetical protein ACTHKG_18850 [Nocardioides sp.]
MSDRSGADAALAVVGPMLGRALLVAVAAVLLVVGYLVTAGARGRRSADHGGRAPAPEHRVTSWKASYSQQFPGCVASVLWPERRTPVAVVVLLPRGKVERISRDAAAHGALQHSRFEDARIIGACYPQ